MNTFGKSEKCDIVFPAFEDQSFSNCYIYYTRIHFSIYVANEILYIRDHSKNGTCPNREMVVPQQETQIYDIFMF